MCHLSCQNFKQHLLFGWDILCMSYLLCSGTLQQFIFIRLFYNYILHLSLFSLHGPFLNILIQFSKLSTRSEISPLSTILTQQ